MVLRRRRWGFLLPLCSGKNNTGQLADAGWPVLYGRGSLCALHLHHATEAHEGHGKETR